MPNFLKRGSAAHEQQVVENKLQELRKQQYETNRFYIPQNDEKPRHITFLDGKLNSNGMIDATAFYQHQLQLNGSWQNWFVCTEDNEPCPICAIPRQYRTFVYAFSIIDHTPYTGKTGKVYENQKKLFVCKQDSFKRLSKRAEKGEGLAGCTFEVTRLGQKSDGCGSDFEFTSKNTAADLLKKYPSLKMEDLKPLEYEKVIVYRSRDELLKMGIGQEGGALALGSDDAKAQLDGKQAADATDYSGTL
jgi:hypothetical protein